MMDDKEYLKNANLTLSDKVLKKRRFKSNILDLHMKEFMLGHAVKYQSKDKETIDVGASVGLYASKFAEYSKHVHCFEAIPFVHDQRLSLLLDRYDNITTYNFAVCDKEGESTFYLDDKKLGNNSFSNLVDGQEIKVQTTFLDKYNFSNIGFLKIDTEGHELSVLEGAVQLIETQKPTCMIEIYPVFNNGPVDSTFKFMLDTGFYNCFYNHRGEGLKEITSIQHGVDISHSEITIHDGDFLFVSK
jgi:FkbM family methyltransferase